jgi:hypothetical protein
MKKHLLAITTIMAGTVLTSCQNTTKRKLLKIMLKVQEKIDDAKEEL